MLRVGGYINRGDGKGWVLAAGEQVTPAASAAETEAPEQGTSAEVPEQGTSAEAPEQGTSVEGQTVRDRCPDCGKEVAVNKDGSLRKHTCQIEADPPDVTFNSEDEH